MKEKRPNIVYLLNDHQAYYGHRAKRPVYDNFAAQGIHFERAYSASPLCAPARRSMLTSLHPHNHGELCNGDEHPFDRELYLDILQEAGYRQYYFGKWDAGPGTAYDHGCTGFSYPSYNNPYTKPEYKAYLEELGLPEPEIFIEQDFISWDNREREGCLIRQDGPWCNEHAAGIMMTPKETHESFFLAHLARKKLKEVAESESDQPFSLRVDFWGPHQPYFPTKEFADMYSPNEIELPLSFYENVYGNNKPNVYATEFNKGISRDGKLIFPNPLSEERWRRVLARDYAQITQIDAAAGVVLDALQEYGLEENTLVIMTTDHGDSVACHGGHFDKASYMPEEMLRIPFAMRYPSVIPPARVSTDLVSNMDVGATILDAAQTSYTDTVDGRSLLPLAKGENEGWRDYFVVESHGHMENHIGRALITDDFKFVYNKNQLNELYRLEDDPSELNNLAVREEYQETCTAMLNQLKAWAVQTGDTSFLECLQYSDRH